MYLKLFSQLDFHVVLLASKLCETGFEVYESHAAFEGFCPKVMSRKALNLEVRSCEVLSLMDKVLFESLGS